MIGFAGLLTYSGFAAFPPYEYWQWHKWLANPLIWAHSSGTVWESHPIPFSWSIPKGILQQNREQR